MSGEQKLPIVDCKEIVCGTLKDVENTLAFKKFTQSVGDGIRNFGFLYMVNHATPPEQVKNLFEKSRKFFQLPSDVKAKYKKVDQLVKFHGFSSCDDEAVGELERERSGRKGAALPDLKECFDIWGESAMVETNFPTEVPGFKQAADDFRLSLIPLVEKTFRAFADYLKLDDPDYFIKRHRALLKDPTIKSHNLIRTNYYFPLSLNEDAFSDESGYYQRLGAHIDLGSITFLFQDECGGLEAKLPDAVWIDVKPIKNSIIFNGGLMLEVWSSGNLPAAIHRVAARNETSTCVRQSVGLFVMPDAATEMHTIVSRKPNWNPPFSYSEGTTHYEMFNKAVSYMRDKEK